MYGCDASTSPGAIVFRGGCSDFFTQNSVINRLWADGVSCGGVRVEERHLGKEGGGGVDRAQQDLELGEHVPCYGGTYDHQQE